MVSIQLKVKKMNTCLILFGNPFENVIHSFRHLAIFTEFLECAEHSLRLVDEGGRLGKSPLLMGLIWIFYRSCGMKMPAMGQLSSCHLTLDDFTVRMSSWKPVVGGSGQKSATALPNPWFP